MGTLIYTTQVLVLVLLLAGPAAAQPKVTEAVGRVDLQQGARQSLPPLEGPLKLDSLKARYRYQIACYTRLLRAEKQLRRCANARRVASGEFHDRLDFVIKPDGKLSAFSVRKSKDRLQACLRPHVRQLTFPAFTGRASYNLQVLIGAPAAQQVSVYPVSSAAERRAYSRAVFWAYSPWSMAISRCAEWVDLSLGRGYRVRLATAINGRGGAVTLELRVKGVRASAALTRLLPCVTPFLRSLRAPRHAGAKRFIYKHGTTTTSWGKR
jgi:hypothetical protein